MMPLLPTPPCVAVLLATSPPRPSRADADERWDARKNAIERYGSDKKSATSSSSTTSSSASRASQGEKWVSHASSAERWNRAQEGSLALGLLRDGRGWPPEQHR
ncbi:hypothetical protein HU200_031681 [Digitaria exilis]|uniref:Uncharacterized protein n=1 Tax=Digitaria exilis TaxID=1010633 RepID=A0A835BPQ0_9POAL|nr:hypothetical protein HU200_031681 [Digitaria exilis]